MKTINRFLRGIVAIALSGAIMLGASVSMANIPKVGELIATDRVDVISGGVGFPVARGTQILFDGDGVRTSAETLAPIEFPGKGAVTVGFNSEVVVSEKSGAVHITLKKGGLQFSFNKGQAFQIQAENQVIASEATLMQKIAESTEQVRGIVVIESGKVHVIPDTEGVVVITGQEARPVALGEAWEIDLDGNQLVKTQAVEGEEKTDASGNTWVAVVGLVGLVWALKKANEEDAAPGS
jgi:hypothetical protein